MCVMSMVMDHYLERWTPLGPVVAPFQPVPVPWNITIAQPGISAAEIQEFRLLLERAREYDRRHNEPDCELDEKRQVLKQLAKSLGVDISFIDSRVEPPSINAIDPVAQESTP